MIAFLNGTVERQTSDGFIINVNGVGYRIVTSSKTAAKLTVKSEVKINTHLYLREDIMQLYGFADDDEQNMFESLISVSKIGPKMAVCILSAYTPGDIVRHISNKDISALAAVPGLGKKTAERIVLELKDKVGAAHFDKETYSITTEALNALVALGYSEIEARNALRDIEDCSSAEEIVKRALGRLAK